MHWRSSVIQIIGDGFEMLYVNLHNLIEEYSNLLI